MFRIPSVPTPRCAAAFLLCVTLCRVDPCRADPSPPRPPVGVSAYSDFRTPDSIRILWTNPSSREDGTPLGPFSVRITRDSTLVTPIENGAEAFVDTGLVDGTLYRYELQAVDGSTGGASSPVSISWHAGGHPVPSPPADVGVEIMDGAYRVFWTKPATQRDGTPYDDHGGYFLRRNGTMLAILSGNVTQFLDSTAPPTADVFWQVAAFDREPVRNTSDLTEPLPAPPPDPRIAVPSEVTASLAPGEGTTTAVLRVTNRGRVFLNFVIDGRPPWATVDLGSGTAGSLASVDVTVRFSAAGLETGLHTGEFTIRSNDATTPEVRVPVSLRILLPPRIQVTPDTLRARMDRLELHEIHGLHVGNVGELPLTFRFSTPSPWITFSPAYSVVPAGDSVRAVLTMRPEGRPEGNHETSLVVSSDDPVTPRVMVPILLEITSTPPTLIEPAPITFRTLLDGTPSSLYLDLRNGGTAVLTYTLRTDVPWLTVSARTGTIAGLGVTQILVSAWPGGLALGTYNGLLSILTNDPARPQFDVPVTLSVEDGRPRMLLGADTLDFGTASCSNVSRSLAIQNAGFSTLTGTVTSDVDWLGFAPTFSRNFNVSEPLTVSVIVARLESGVHRAQLTLTTNAAFQPVRTIPVVVSVGRPELKVDPGEIVFYVAAGAGAVTKRVRLENPGTGVATAVPAGDPPLPPWLHVSGGGGIENGSARDIAFTVDPSGLHPGVYRATLALGSNDCRFARVAIPVRMEVVEGAPDIRISGESLTFHGTTASPPQWRGVFITNPGARDVAFDVKEDAPWLLAEPSSGVLHPGDRVRIEVHAAPAALEPGTHVAAVRVETSGGEPDFTIGVTLDVRTATPETTPDRIAISEAAWTCRNGDSAWQFLEMIPLVPGETYRASLGLRIEDQYGDVTLEQTNLFGAALEGRPWPQGAPWLVASPALNRPYPPDSPLAVTLDPAGGAVTLHDGTDILHRFSWGVAGGVGPPVPGGSLVLSGSSMTRSETATPEGSLGPFLLPVCDCPSNTLSAFRKYEASVQRTRSISDSDGSSYRTAYAGYALASGECSLRAKVSSAAFRVGDLYTLTGVPAGTAVRLNAVLTLDGNLPATGIPARELAVLRLSFDDRSGRPVELNRESSGGERLEMVVPMVVRPYEPFAIDIGADLVCGANAGTADTRLTFRDLPPGTAIHSCQGFSMIREQGPIVEAAAGSGEDGRARLEWTASGGRRFLNVLRSPAGAGPGDGVARTGRTPAASVPGSASWTVVGSAEVEPGGRVLFTDHEVESGSEFVYRLDAGGTDTGGIAVRVGEAPRLALISVSPNPSRGALTAYFTLPERAPVRVELFDVTGRRVLDRDMGTAGPGPASMDLTRGTPLASGLYLVRITQGGRSRSMKAIVVR